MTLIANVKNPDFDDLFGKFLNLKREIVIDVDSDVTGIIDQVRCQGDTALVELTKKFDRHTVDENRLGFSKTEKAEFNQRC